MHSHKTRKEKIFRFVEIDDKNLAKTKHGTLISQNIIQGSARLYLKTSSMKLFMLELLDFLTERFKVNNVFYPKTEICSFRLECHSLEKKKVKLINVLIINTSKFFINWNGYLTENEILILAACPSWNDEKVRSQIWCNNCLKQLLIFLENNKIHQEVKISGNLTYKRYLKSYKVAYVEHIILGPIWNTSDLKLRKLFQKIKYLPKLKSFKSVDPAYSWIKKIKLNGKILKFSEDNFLSFKYLSFGVAVKFESHFEVNTKQLISFYFSNLRRLRKEGVIKIDFNGSHLFHFDEKIHNLHPKI